MRAGVRVLVLVCLVVAAGGGSVSAAADTGDGRIGPALGMTGNGRLLDPIGRLTTVGNFPTGGALSPDGRFYWVVDSGHGSDDVKVVDVASGAVRQTLPLPGAYVGVAFAPDGRTAYVSGEPKGGSPTEGATKGDDGDVIHVFAVNPANGQAAEQEPIALPKTSGGTYRQNSFPPAPNATSWPTGLAVSPDGDKLVVALNSADKVAIVDTATRAVSLADVGAYPYGVAFDPRRPVAYVSNEYDGTISALDLGSGKVTGTIPVGGPEGDRNAHPEGLLADPQRPLLYVAVTNRDRIAVIDTERLKTARYVDVGRPEGIGTAPVALAIAPDEETLYSADANEDAVAAIALTDRPAAGAPAGRMVVQVRPVRSIAAYARGLRKAGRRRAAALQHARSKAARKRARARYAATASRLRRTLLVGTAMRGCSGPSRAAERRYTSAVLRALKRRGSRRATALSKAGHGLAEVKRCPAPGYQPDAKAFTVLGRVPTASYATDVQVTPDGRRLLWLAARGFGAGPNSGYGDHPADSDHAPFGTYVPDMLIGRVGAMERPTDLALAPLSARADREVRPANGETAPAGTPLQGPDGGASDKIRYVFYVVRENRTYDQILGSDTRGDGDPSLELFDDNGAAGPAGGVTPNAHKLTRQFPLLDHVYADSEVSIDGHLITSGAYATDYSVKGLHPSYSGRGKGDDIGIAPVSFPPNDFVFDQAVRQGVPFRAYGEVGAGNQPFGNDGRPTYAQVIANTDTAYPTNIQIGCLAPGGAPGVNIANCSQDSGVVGGQGQVIGTSRINSFQAQFQSQLATNSVPRFNYLILPNDHTNGTSTGHYTPKAMVADNDLGLGQLVQLVSNSPIWKESAIFVVEDDSQDGADHVDAHRMPAFVISPWAKRGAVVSTRYDQYSFLRTAMMIVGLKPLSLNDALATPLYDAFISGDQQPDVEGTRYTAVMPQQPIDQTNTSSSPSAALSNRLPWDRLDRVPQAISDRILWKSVYGPSSRPPHPGPHASAVEHARAVGAARVWRRGGNVRRWLLSKAPVDADG